MTALITNTCSRCHSAAGPQKSLTENMTGDRSMELYSRVWSADAAYQMPPTGSTQAQRYTVSNWLAPALSSFIQGSVQQKGK